RKLPPRSRVNSSALSLKAACKTLLLAHRLYWYSGRMSSIVINGRRRVLRLASQILAHGVFGDTGGVVFPSGFWPDEGQAPSNPKVRVADNPPGTAECDLGDIPQFQMSKEEGSCFVRCEPS